MTKITLIDLSKNDVLRRFYRPIVFNGVIILVVLVYIYISEGMVSFTAVLVVSIAVGIFSFVIGWIGYCGVKRFVAGLDAGGLDVEVVKDTFSCTGGYAVRLSTSVGFYRVESFSGHHLTIRFKGPNTFGWQRIPLTRARASGLTEARKQLVSGWK